MTGVVVVPAQAEAVIKLVDIPQAKSMVGFAIIFLSYVSHKKSSC